MIPSDAHNEYQLGDHQAIPGIYLQRVLKTFKIHNLDVVEIINHPQIEFFCEVKI